MVQADRKEARNRRSEQAVVDLYDDRMYDRLVDEYYGQSGFLNFGYWDEDTATPAEAGANLVDKLVSMLADKNGPVLDVACGTGATTRRLSHHVAANHLTGINISHKQLLTAGRRVPGAGFCRMDAVALGFSDASFANVICVEAAFHFNTREAFLREASRVLRPGGTLVLSDALISGRLADRRPHWHAENTVTDPDEYAAICRRAGFEHVEIVNATEACWKPCYWSVVRFMHGRFWEGQITLSQMRGFLDRIYRLAEDLEFYILVAARNGRARRAGRDSRMG